MSHMSKVKKKRIRLKTVWSWNTEMNNEQLTDLMFEFNEPCASTNETYNPNIYKIRVHMENWRWRASCSLFRYYQWIILWRMWEYDFVKEKKGSYIRICTFALQFSHKTSKNAMLLQYWYERERKKDLENLNATGSDKSPISIWAKVIFGNDEDQWQAFEILISDFVLQYFYVYIDERSSAERREFRKWKPQLRSFR